MSLILVVEKDAGLANQIASTLRAEGHAIDAVASCDAGLQHAAIRSPTLVLVSGVLPGASELLGRYSSRRGGPGSVVMVPAQMAGQMSADQFQADFLLASPVQESELRSLAQRLAPSTLGGPPEPSLLPNVGTQLTSEEIFGDVLAEVEADAERQKSSAGFPAVGAPSVSARPASVPTNFQPPQPAAP